MKYFKYFVVASIGFITLAHPLLAQSNKENTFSLRLSPAYHEIILNDKKTSEEIAILIKNPSKQDLTLNVTSLTIRQEDITGRIQYLLDKISEKEKRESYITILTPTIELKAGGMATISARIDNTTSLSPGGNYAAIVAQITRESNTASGVLPSISSLLFTIKEGGAISEITLESISLQKKLLFSYPNTFTARFKNTGNIHLVPYGRVEVRDSLGRLTHSGNLNNTSTRIFPDNSRDIIAEIRTLTWSLPISRDQITIVGEDSRKVARYSYVQYVWSINPWFLGIALLLFIAIFKYKSVMYMRCYSFVRLIKENIRIKLKK